MVLNRMKVESCRSAFIRVNFRPSESCFHERMLMKNLWLKTSMRQVLVDYWRTVLCDWFCVMLTVCKIFSRLPFYRCQGTMPDTPHLPIGPMQNQRTSAVLCEDSLLRAVCVCFVGDASRSCHFRVFYPIMCSYIVSMLSSVYIK